MVQSVTRPPDRTCDYAACRQNAAEYAVGWWFCLRHRREHDLIMAGEDIPDLPRHELPISHGTYSGHRTHQRRGEQPCSECMAAFRLHNQITKKADRWHRRAAC